MADVAGLPHILGEKLYLVLPTIVALLALIIVPRVFAKDPLKHIPDVGQELGSDEKRRQAFLMDSRHLYQEGYQKFKDGVFKLLTTRTTTPVVVVAPRYLNELKKLPDDVLSFDAAIAETMHVKYTQIEPGNKSIPHAIKTSLTPSLPRLSPPLTDEARESFNMEMPPCDNWTPVNINRILLRVVAMVSGRIFIGPDLCRSEEYLDAAINYTIEVMMARGEVDAMPAWKRPFLARSLPAVKRLEARIKQAHAFMQPVVEARKRLPADQKPDDMLQWLMESQQKFGDDNSVEKLARLQLGLSFAAIHTTTMTATNAFYNLAAYPHLIPILRDEIVSVLSEHNGEMSAPALQAMKKLDSFLKETLRFHPPGTGSFSRKVLKPFNLSSGEYIPKGVVIEVPAHAIARDPEVFVNPDEFDGLRFYNIRQEAREKGEAEAAAQNQFVSVSQSSLTFGYGRHACPGRFLAANEIKMIVATAVMMFDMKLEDGAEGRYANFEFGGTSAPDPSKTLRFKRFAQ
ncbi:cytochrome P450 [Immersiella caudata]|uniref:Cytochrome P450 n=1 Tax=Immersiella caudata TaxID=314043 RepID=A0AA39W9Y2_9PEZI|nr:cytochrome P450 [Immersiella caudata]